MALKGMAPPPPPHIVIEDNSMPQTRVKQFPSGLELSLHSLTVTALNSWVSDLVRLVINYVRSYFSIVFELWSQPVDTE